MSKYVVLTHRVTEEHNIETNFHEFDRLVDALELINKKQDEQTGIELFEKRALRNDKLGKWTSPPKKLKDIDSPCAKEVAKWPIIIKEKP